MKILYYSPHPTINMAAPSGPGTHIREVVKAIEFHGHEVVRLIAGGENVQDTNPSIKYKKRWYKALIPRFIWQCIKDYRLIQFDNQLKLKLEEIIDKEQPDLIYERAYYLMQSGHTTASERGIQYFCEMNAPYPQEKSIMEGLSIFHRRAIKNELAQVRSARRTFVVSTALKSYLEGKLNAKSTQIVVTPNAVNPNNVIMDLDLLNKIKTQLRLKSNDKVIGFVGSIFPYHGVDILLEAFLLLKKEGVGNAKLLIVGDGEILQKLIAAATKAGISDSILFTGNVPHKQVYTYIEAMDITVMAKSNWYGSPVKIFEYGIMNKIVIAPDEIPVHDVMKHKMDGYIVPPNANELKNCILEILNNPTEALQMASNFKNKIMTHYTWNHVGQTILEEAQ